MGHLHGHFTVGFGLQQTVMLLTCLPALPALPVVRTGRPKAGALAEERDALTQQLEMERTAAAEAQKEVRRHSDTCWLANRSFKCQGLEGSAAFAEIKLLQAGRRLNAIK